MGGRKEHADDVDRGEAASMVVVVVAAVAAAAVVVVAVVVVVVVVGEYEGRDLEEDADGQHDALDHATCVTTTGSGPMACPVLKRFLDNPARYIHRVAPRVAQRLKLLVLDASALDL